MTLNPYPKYKDSGVAWLGDVPEGWKVAPLKRLAVLVTGITPPSTEEGAYGELGDFPWLRPEDLNETGSPSEATKWLSDDGVKYVRSISPQSTAICCIGTIGKAGYVEAPFGTNQQITSATFLDNAKFGYYSVIAARTTLEAAATGNVLKILNTERLGSIPFPVPGSAEQTAIAAFLDRETAKIDDLIAEQEKLIALLAEKRQATISHAVTKGLNPDAPMKDSGVEWLGEIPAHWEAERLKFSILKVESGTSVNATDTPAQDGELGVLKTSCVYDGDFRPEENKSVVPEEYDRVTCAVKADTLIVSRMNTPSLVGAAGYVSKGNDNLFLPDRLWQVSFHEALPSFVHAWTRTQYYRLQVEMVCTGTSSSMQNLSQGQFGDFIVSLPPIAEQREIVAFLTSETTKLDDLSNEANRVIELLKERRTALISAAVTGKIDVRGAVSASEAA